MNKLTIELSEDQMCRLKAYTKTDNYSINDPNYRTCEEIAAYLISLIVEVSNLPFIDDKKAMAVYNKELKKLKGKI
jgi:hypothetical protein